MRIGLSPKIYTHVDNVFCLVFFCIRDDQTDVEIVKVCKRLMVI